MLLKLTAEMGIIAESDLITDIQGIITGIRQKNTGTFDTQPIQIRNERQACFMFK